MDNVRKIKGLGKAIKIIASILSVVLIVCFVFTAIFGVSLIVMPKQTLKITANGNFDVSASMPIFEKMIAPEDTDYENVSFSVKGDTISASGSFNDETFEFGVNKLGFLVLSILAYIICMFLVMLFVEKLGKEISKSESPFTEGVVKYLKCIGFSLLALTFIPETISSIAMKIVFSQMPYSISLNINFAMVILALLFIMLIYIFQYGIGLQKQSDETL